ncbi:MULTISPECIES: hypothetical protein [Aminobacterium]|nr:hypothetical protein [Aminobacterium sp. UBA1031]
MTFRYRPNYMTGRVAKKTLYLFQMAFKPPDHNLVIIAHKFIITI